MQKHLHAKERIRRQRHARESASARSAGVSARQLRHLRGGAGKCAPSRGGRHGIHRVPALLPRVGARCELVAARNQSLREALEADVFPPSAPRLLQGLPRRAQRRVASAQSAARGASRGVVDDAGRPRLFDRHRASRMEQLARYLPGPRALLRQAGRSVERTRGDRGHRRRRRNLPHHADAGQSCCQSRSFCCCCCWLLLLLLLLPPLRSRLLRQCPAQAMPRATPRCSLRRT